MRAVSREVLLRRVLLLPSLALLAPPDASFAAVKLSSGAEEIRKAASLIPGYGPPDISYPPVFLGRWRVESRVADVKTPLGEEAAPSGQLRTALQLMSAENPLHYDARFVETEGGPSGVVVARDNPDSLGLSARSYGGGMVIADRAFNAERRAAARFDAFAKRWCAS